MCMESCQLPLKVTLFTYLKDVDIKNKILLRMKLHMLGHTGNSRLPHDLSYLWIVLL